MLRTRCRERIPCCIFFSAWKRRSPILFHVTLQSASAGTKAPTSSPIASIVGAGRSAPVPYPLPWFQAHLWLSGASPRAATSAGWIAVTAPPTVTCSKSRQGPQPSSAASRHLTPRRRPGHHISSAFGGRKRGRFGGLLRSEAPRSAMSGVKSCSLSD